MNKPFLRKQLSILLRDAALIVALAMLVGMAVNIRLLWNVWSGEIPGSAVLNEPGSENEPLPMPISLAELSDLSADEVLLLDARHVDLYLQGHLPAARSLPWGEIESRLDDFRREVPLHNTLVVYCSGYGCEDSFLLAQRLMAAGYEDVRVFEGGMPEWRDAGLPVEKGQP
jgi:rhodanese-related sulfurtransferase